MMIGTFLLLTYGITNIAVFGSIFQSWRDLWDRVSPNFFGRLFSCPLCLSTWVGFILSFTFGTLGYQTPMSLYGIDNFWLMVFLDGCITSGGVWLLHTAQEFLERAFNSEL